MCVWGGGYRRDVHGEFWLLSLIGRQLILWHKSSSRPGHKEQSTWRCDSSLFLSRGASGCHWGVCCLSPAWKWRLLPGAPLTQSLAIHGLPQEIQSIQPLKELQSKAAVDSRSWEARFRDPQSPPKPYCRSLKVSLLWDPVIRGTLLCNLSSIVFVRTFHSCSRMFSKVSFFARCPSPKPY